MTSHRNAGSSTLQIISISWNITLYSLLKFNRRFGGICHFHLHDRRMRQPRNQHGEGTKGAWRWRWYNPPKRRLSSNGLHWVISESIEIVITTAVRIPNLTGLTVRVVTCWYLEVIIRYSRFVGAPSLLSCMYILPMLRRTYKSQNIVTKTKLEGWNIWGTSSECNIPVYQT
jgi:hypothetical protein